MTMTETPTPQTTTITLNGTPNNVTMSNGNLTATRNSTAIGGVNSTSFDGPAVGNLGVKYYFEVTLLTSVTNGNSIGFMTPADIVTNSPSVPGIPAAKTAVLLGSSSSIVYLPNGVNTGIDLGAAVVNDVIGVSIDMDNALVWFRRNGGNWNNSGTANPATGVGGVQYSLRSGYAPYVSFAAGSNSTDVMKSNFGQTSFVGTPPSGFGSSGGSGGGAVGGWFPFGLTTTITPGLAGYVHVRVRAAKPGTTYYIDPKVAVDAVVVPPVTYATWDPATVASVTLSGGNLVATNTGTSSADQGAHVAAANGKITGKYYFEMIYTTAAAGANVGVGIGTTTSTYTNMGNDATVGDMSFRGTGNIYANGTNTGLSIGVAGSGTGIGIAVDLDNHNIWFRKTPSGFWNNSGTANPATNTGGLVIPAGTMVPFVTFGGGGGAANNIVTANFGASAFSGAVPSGFTSGWPQ